MAKIRTVVDLLAGQSVEALHEMRDANKAELIRAQAELARLKVEAEQIEQALKRAGSRGTRVTGDDVFEAALAAEPPFAAADVAAILAERGRDATVNAVRNHLNRLAGERGVLSKLEDGRYSVKSPATGSEPPDTVDFPTSPTDDDIPF